VTGLELESYLHAHIPLTRAMQVSVVSVEPDSVLLSAPLAPNTNHRDTVFGGSAAAGDFTARGFIPKPETWQSFMRLLERKGRARITASSELQFNGRVVGRFEGDFVALSRDF